MRLFRKGQGATEYLLMLAAVLVIVAIAVYYVATAGGYPVVSVNPEEFDSNIKITVLSGSIPAGDWQYSVSTTSGSYTWETGNVELKAPSVTIKTGLSAGNYYVSLKHKPSGHIYFADQKITI